VQTHHVIARRGPLRWFSVLGATLVAAFGVAAYAGAGASSARGVAHAAKGGCGTVPQLGYHDQSGVLAKLGTSYASQFNGYATPVFKSAYANFKPKGKPPYTVGVLVTAPLAPTQAALDPMLKKELGAIKGVKKVIELTSGPTALTTQLQQAHSLLQQHVSFIVAQPLVPQPFIPIAQAAEKAGIPFISIFNATPTPDSINIAPNSVGDALTSGAVLAKAIGGKGVVLGVHGIPSTGVDQESFKGWAAAFKQCPGITFDTSLVGAFQPSVAKGALLSYLSSHPQPVAGVVETAGMTSGILQAFQQAGRPVPKIVDVGPAVGELVYFKGQPSQLADGLTVTPSGVTAAARYTIQQLIAGHGPKLSELSSLSDVVNDATLSHYIPAGAGPTDESVVEGAWLPGSYLSKLFNS
jgi:ribose transport system substrate-binding protein